MAPLFRTCCGFHISAPHHPSLLASPTTHPKSPTLCCALTPGRRLTLQYARTDCTPVLGDTENPQFKNIAQIENAFSWRETWKKLPLSIMLRLCSYIHLFRMVYIHLIISISRYASVQWMWNEVSSFSASKFLNLLAESDLSIFEEYVKKYLIILQAKASRSLTFLNFERVSHYGFCPTVCDCLTVYPSLLL